MGRGVLATRRQIKVASRTGRDGRPSTPAAAASGVNRVLQRAVAETNRSHRRDASLANVRGILAHGALTGATFRVPAGKCVIVLTPPGQNTTTANNIWLRHAIDVNRIVVGHLRPGGGKAYVKRFDAGQKIPDMLLSEDTGDPEKGEPRKRWETGVYRLPLTPQDFQPNSETRIATVADIPIVRTTLSRLLDELPPGKYIVGGCRSFYRGADLSDAQKAALFKLEMDTPVAPTRSDPGSLTATPPSASSYGSVNWKGHPDKFYEELRKSMTGNWTPGRPTHISGRKRPPRLR